MAVRIDIVDPSPEGAELATRLRDAGFAVTPRHFRDLPHTDADALVLGVDADGALEALHALRGHGTAPLVLLGTIESQNDQDFGAHEILPRPVAFEALRDAVEKLLASL